MSKEPKERERWKVEWISTMPLIPGTGDLDWDLATRHARAFRTEDEARDFARQLLRVEPLPWFEYCDITHQRLAVDEHLSDEDIDIWQWQDDGKPVEIKADDIG